MTGWNLPPGCSVRDLPGNSAEDEAMEAFYDAFYEQAEKCGLGSTVIETNAFGELAEWAWKKMGEAYATGYGQGTSDANLAQEYNKGGQVR